MTTIIVILENKLTSLGSHVTCFPFILPSKIKQNQKNPKTNMTNLKNLLEHFCACLLHIDVFGVFFFFLCTAMLCYQS